MDGQVPMFRFNQRVDMALVERFKRFLDKVPSDTVFIGILFDSNGGYTSAAIVFIGLMRQSGFRFFAKACGNVHSAAMVVYLHCEKYATPYPSASALLHRATGNAHSIPSWKVRRIEHQIFKLIQSRLKIPLEEIYRLANKDTYLVPTTDLGKKFFLKT